MFLRASVLPTQASLRPRFYLSLVVPVLSDQNQCIQSILCVQYMIQLITVFDGGGVVTAHSKQNSHV
jgi:hypothetical protein